jgi:hypothetical protein
MSQIATRQPDMLALADYERAKDILSTPMVLLDRQLRPALFECWACHRHLAGMETSLPIAGMFSIWITRWGLSIDDARDILEQSQHPDRIASHKFASDLTTALASAVSQRLKKRSAEAEAEQRRKDAGAATAERPQVASMLASLSQSFGAA